MSVEVTKRSKLPLRPGRRHLLAGLGAIAVGATNRPLAAQTALPKLAVFLHVDVRLRYFQGLLREVMPDVDVTAYSRFGDVVQAIEGGVHALFALRPVLEYQGLKVARSGRAAGRTTEPYVLVANGREVTPRSIRRVGTLDLLGRRGTQEWVHRLLKASPEVNRVTKVEDLLPMLQLEMVDAVFIPEALAVPLREKSRLPLKATALGVEVGLPALAVLKPGGEKVGAALPRIAGNLQQIMRIDGWE